MKRVSQSGRRHPEHLGLAEVADRESQRVPGDVVDREAVADRRAERQTDGRVRPGAGPETAPRTSALALRAERRVDAARPLRSATAGRSSTLTRPPSVFRPNSALCGPRTNSICSMSSSSTFDELAFSCGTPSM